MTPRNLQHRPGWNAPRKRRIAAFWFWILTLFIAGPARAKDVVIVLTGDAAPYAMAESGFKEKFTAPDTTIRSVFLSDIADKGMAAAVGKSPALVVAVGTPAAEYLHDNLAAQIPIVYCMVSNPAQAGLNEGRAASGITIDVPIAAQFSLISQAAPKTRRVGMLYHSSAADAKQQIQRVRQSLPAGWNLEAVAVEDYGSIADAIDALTSRHIDIVWTNIDSGIYETATVRTLLLAGLRTNLPVFGFSPAFVRAGALLGIGVDPTAQGQQAAALALRVLKNPSDTSIPRFQAPDQFQIAVNLMMAEKLGIQIPAELIGRAKYVFKEDN